MTLLEDRFPVSLLALLFVAFPMGSALAAGDAPGVMLKRDLVTEVEGRFVHEQANVCRVQMPASLGGGLSTPFSTRRRVEAPVSLIGRDNFVAITTRYLMNQRIAFAQLFVRDISAVDALTAVKCQRIENPEGSSDFVIQMIMDDAGISVGILDTGSGKRSMDRHSWADVLTP